MTIPPLWETVKSEKSLIEITVLRKLDYSLNLHDLKKIKWITIMYTGLRFASFSTQEGGFFSTEGEKIKFIQQLMFTV